MHRTPHHNYQPPRDLSRRSEIVAGIILALIVVGFTVAFTLELAK
jgi:hypothetical protein